MSTAAPTFISAPDMLAHWQGHRRLTRRVIELFPDDKLFTFSLGGMRTFGELANELLFMAAPMAHGLATLDWKGYEPKGGKSKSEVLALWDQSTKDVDKYWAPIPAGRFQETITSFGQYTGPGHLQVLSVVDNEVHHRGQGYVYLRALGIAPPAFWER
ncbi:MAG: damage-inducible protein DinB [Gemmatimonadetes bacterium]|nr:damage-inducible protein DinB [Gemmatimonadota bacterium]